MEQILYLHEYHSAVQVYYRRQIGVGVYSSKKSTAHNTASDIEMKLSQSHGKSLYVVAFKPTRGDAGSLVFRQKR